MLIKLKDIVLPFYGVGLSEIFSVNAFSQNDDFTITYDNTRVILVDESGYSYTDTIPIKKSANLRVQAQVFDAIVSSPYTISLFNVKTNTTIVITGNVVLLNQKTTTPIELTNNVNCNPSIINGNVKLSLDQNNNFIASFDFPSSVSLASGAVTTYETKSSNGVELGSDAALISTAVAMSFSGQTFSVQLSNPNYNLSPLDPFGFINEVDYTLSFNKDLTVDGTVYTTRFLVNIIFKPTTVSFLDRGTQQVVFDSFHQKVIIAHNFACNVNAKERQFLFGLRGKKLFNIPTNVITQIPDALNSIGTTSLKPLNVSIIATSLTKSIDHYTLKLVFQALPPMNRSLIKMNYDIPLRVSLRGFFHDFIVPVRING